MADGPRLTISRSAALMLLFALSLTVKLAGVAYMNRNLGWNLVAPDARDSYVPLAKDLAQGKGYQLEGNHLAATKLAPAYPLFLAAVYRIAGFDVPTWVFGVLNALMRAATTLLVFALAARAFGERAGSVAAVIHAVDPWEAFWTAFVLKESLAVLLSIAGIYLAVRALERPTWLRGGLAGAVIGLASLTRFATLGFFFVLLALFAVAATRGRIATHTALRLAAAATFGVVLALSPWLARNMSLLGGPFVYTQAGLYLFVSNGPGAERAPDTKGYSGLSTGDLTNVPAVYRRKRPYARREAELVSTTVTHVATHPFVFARLVAARVVNMWRPTFAGSSWSNLIVLGLPYCVMLAAAIAGVAIGVRHPPSPAQQVLYWTVGFYVLLHAVFWSEIRYRQYVTPLLSAFAGYAAVALYDRFHPVRETVSAGHAAIPSASRRGC